MDFSTDWIGIAGLVLGVAGIVISLLIYKRQSSAEKEAQVMINKLNEYNENAKKQIQSLVQWGLVSVLLKLFDVKREIQIIMHTAEERDSVEAKIKRMKITLAEPISGWLMEFEEYAKREMDTPLRLHIDPNIRARILRLAAMTESIRIHGLQKVKDEGGLDYWLKECKDAATECTNLINDIQTEMNVKF